MHINSDKLKYKKKEEILDKLFSLQRFGIKPGLERTQHLLDFLGNPQDSFPSIHVAGTNGKGSVCSMLASVLMEAGYKTALYTSPHLVRFNERILINKIEISDNELIKLSEILMAEGEKIGATFYEITTAIAFQYFAEHQVEIAVIETGLGGRFDSTNVLKPLFSVITNIDIDHTEYLGKIIQEIAFEKAGIIKENTPVIVSLNNKEVISVLEKKANEMNSEIIYADNFYTANNIKYFKILSMSFSLESNKNKYPELNLDVAGEHQVQNAITSMTALDMLSGHFKINVDSIYRGFKNIKINTGMKARIEFINNKYPLVLDVAHNPGAVKRTVETLYKSGYKDTKWNIVFAVMSDKDAFNILSYLKPVCSKLFLTMLKIDRAMSTEDLMNTAIKVGLNNYSIYDNVENAIKSAFKLKEPLLILGSFYLIGEVLPVLEDLIK
jgi:dihydrofolate synthase/folylpolyglutamate synthase